jgi:hypothetical protein
MHVFSGTNDVYHRPARGHTPRAGQVFFGHPLYRRSARVLLWLRLAPRATAPAAEAGGARRTSADPRKLWEKGVEAPSVPPRPEGVARRGPDTVIRQNSRGVYNRNLLALVLGGLDVDPTGKFINSAEIHLMGSGGFNPTPDTLLADLEGVEAAFSGYAASAASMTGPIRIGTLDMGAAYYVAFFATDVDPFVPDTVTGFWIKGATDSDWAFAGLFDAAAAIAGPLDWLLVDCVCVIPGRFTVTG